MAFVKNNYTYKRINHFENFLNEFCEEKKVIPDFLITMIESEMGKKNINKENFTLKHLRIILKETNNRKYYEYQFNIYEKITGKKFIRINSDDKQKIMIMFYEIGKVYYDYCPKNRKSFFSYHYIVNRICYLLGFDYYLDYLSLFKIKNQSKLYQSDLILSKICKHYYDIWKNKCVINRLEEYINIKPSDDNHSDISLLKNLSKIKAFNN